MSLHPLLEQVRTPWGGRRFYPPGQHPSSRAANEHRAKLLQLPASRERDKALEAVGNVIAAFEEGETEAKERYLRYIKRGEA